MDPQHPNAAIGDPADPGNPGDPFAEIDEIIAAKEKDIMTV